RSDLVERELCNYAGLRSNVTWQLEHFFGSEAMATRASKAVSAAISNQQLTLELVRMVLAGSVRAGIPDDLILSSTKDANKLTIERARLDSAYAVRLYNNILARLESQAETDSKDGERNK